MLNFKKSFEAMMHAEEGVTSIEYALIAALIAIVIFAAVAGVGINLNALFSNVASQLGNAIASAL